MTNKDDDSKNVLQIENDEAKVFIKEYLASCLNEMRPEDIGSDFYSFISAYIRAITHFRNEINTYTDAITIRTLIERKEYGLEDVESYIDATLSIFSEARRELGQDVRKAKKTLRRALRSKTNDITR